MDKARTNPFVSRMRVTTMDKIKLVLGLIILLPLRCLVVGLIVAIASLTGYLLVLVIYMCGLINVPTANCKFKRNCLLFTNSIYSAAMYCAGLHSKTIDNRTQEERNLDSGMIIAAPHVSHMDVPGLCYCPYTYVPVMKYEDKFHPLYGSQLFLANAILVKRNVPDSKQQVINEIVERSKTEHVALYPEATVTNGTSLIQFKTGAFLSGRPVCMGFSRYKYSGSVNRVVWTWISPNVVTMWALTFASWTPIKHSLTYQMYYPNDAEEKCPTLYAENVRQHMAKVLGIHCTRYCFEDAFFIDWAIKANISLSSPVLKLVKLAHKLGKLNILITTESKENTILTEEFYGADYKLTSNLKSVRQRNVVQDQELIDDIEESSNVNCSQENNNTTYLSEVWTHKLIYNYIITNSIKKLETADLLKQIKTVEELVSLIEFPFKVKQKNYENCLNEFFFCLHLNVNQEITVAHFLVFLQLANPILGSLRLRINAANKTFKKANLTEKDALKNILWYLAGLEEFQMNSTALDKIKLFSDDLIERLVDQCTEAMLDNCKHFLQTH